MSIGSMLKDDIYYGSHQLGSLHRLYDAAEKLGMLNWVETGDYRTDAPDLHVSLSSYGKLSITLAPSGEDEEGAVAKWIMKKLMPLVHRFDKGFNNATKEITFTATFDGVEIIVASKPPSTCTVEEYEEEVVVPAVPAVAEKPETTRTIKRYRLVGDCLPIMADVQDRSGEAYEASLAETGTPNEGESAPTVQPSTVEPEGAGVDLVA